jgi:CubicO group peptidase (beta-lactamase class C family)
LEALLWKCKTEDEFERMKGEQRITEVLERGLEAKVFQGAAALVGKRGKIVFRQHVGHRSLIPERVPMLKDTIFDLASLTKPLATTLCIIKLVNEDKILLDQPLAEILPNAVLGDKRDLAPRLLLSHSAGLVDWKPYYKKLIDHPLERRKGLVRQWIIEEAFAYEPGKGNLYSDLGFMLLEWVIEEKTGESLPVYVQEHFYGPLGLKRTLFRSTTEEENPPRPPFTEGGEDKGTKRGRDPLLQPLPQGEGRPVLGLRKAEFAATEHCPWRKKVLQGEVHDDNAWALGGYSGHAGLFSTAEEVYAIVNILREHYFGMRRDFFKPETVREFFRRQNIVEGSDWALGWDTRALEGSSAGRYFSRDSVGHTGFTGTSIWMDLEKDVIAILLTNRVHPKRDNEKIKQFRPVFHDAVMEALGMVNEPQTHTDILAERPARPRSFHRLAKKDEKP